MAPLPGPSGRVQLRSRLSAALPETPAAGNATSSAPRWHNRRAPAPHGQIVDGNAGLSPERWGSGGADPIAHTVLSPMQETSWRSGLQGTYYGRRFVDRHVYFSRGTVTNTGPDNSTGGGRNPQLDGPPKRTLRTINRTVTPQAGSDNTANQDDLTRPYTWLGQQDGTVSRIPGGTPGLYQRYGSRGGFPAPLVGPQPTVMGGPANGYAKGTVLAEGDPADVGGAGAYVDPGPPHGLHSGTEASGRTWASTVSTRTVPAPARIDRPDNSPQAGQTYSQLVQRQGGAPTAVTVQRGQIRKIPSRGWAK